jgi:hypothetical protein
MCVSTRETVAGWGFGNISETSWKHGVGVKFRREVDENV